MNYLEIEKVVGREILDSRGNPTVEAEVLALADQIVDAVKSGAIKKFVVMAGCDGRAKSRSYYSDFAQDRKSTRLNSSHRT